jgi:hypothetical protein
LKSKVLIVAEVARIAKQMNEAETPGFPEVLKAMNLPLG